VGGYVGRLTIATWSGDTWVALACSPGDGVLICSVPHLSLFAVVAAPPPSATLDFSVSSGWFYKQANGFNGAGDAGFSVTDDADANFWSEFQRLGGVDRLGYPISQRFKYGAYVTQAFQKLALQWQPDQGQAVPINFFDDLSARGSDAWLEQARQIPPAANTTSDAGMPFDDVAARHRALVDNYPALRQFYDANPEALAMYGLPVSVRDYGRLVSVRLQGGFLQLWTADVAWAAAGTVVVANGGDVAKEAGLWPSVSVVPSVAVPSVVAPAAQSPDGLNAEQGD
jgi:hypothetical protein